MFTNRLASHFEQQERSLGHGLFMRKRVKFLDVSPLSVRARVTSSEETVTYVVLDEAGVVGVECECPEYDAGLPCRHLWATLLSAEEHGLLPSLNQLPGAALTLHLLSEATPPSAQDEAWPLPRQASYALPTPGPYDPAEAGLWGKGRDDLSRWREVLRSIGNQLRHESRRARRPVAPTRIHYVIDLLDTTYHRNLTLQLFQLQRSKKGEWKRPVPFPFDYAQADQVQDPEDLEILVRLAGAPAPDARAPLYGGAADVEPKNRFFLPRPLWKELLVRICKTGRCYLRLPYADVPQVQLNWDPGDPWVFQLQVEEARGGAEYVVGGLLRRGEERLTLEAVHLVLAGGLVFWGDRVALLDDGNAFPWLKQLRQDERIRIPRESEEEFLLMLYQAQALPLLNLPEALRLREERVRPLPRLRARRSEPEKASAHPPLQAQLHFGYGPCWIEEDGVPARLVDFPERRVFPRDLQAEAACHQRLLELGLKRRRVRGASPDGEARFELPQGRVDAVVQELLREGWLVEVEGRRYRNAGEISLALKTGIDWFEMEGGLDFEGEFVPLPALLTALRKGEESVTLRDGSLGLLPQPWLKSLGLLAAVGRSEQSTLRFQRGQAGLLDVLLADQPEIRSDALFARLREELRTFRQVRPALPPAGFRGALRPYQQQGLGWLHWLRQVGFGGCLADDMGLGKTIQILALLLGRKAGEPLAQPLADPGGGVASDAESEGAVRPSLIVVPRSLLYNWRQEAERFAPGLRILVHAGLERQAQRERFESYDCILTTYGILRRDVLAFREILFDYAILDEAQVIKNPRSESAKAARLLRARQRLVLTGTPVENHLGDLWSILDFLNPGMLGAAPVFERFLGPGRRLEPQAQALLARAVRPFVLRRTKQEVAKELPEKLEQTLCCELGSEERKRYNELRDHYRARLLGSRPADAADGQGTFHVLEALLRLRQSACHPGLLDEAQLDRPSAKLELLLEQLLELREEGHKALVFSQFTSFLAIVRRRLDERQVPYAYLDGQTRDREAEVQRFQNDPDCSAFLISLKAGGFGLNLTAAEYVFLLDPWWNPAVEAQAIDRAHRIGQTRRVFAYRLISRDTVEEKVVILQDRKRELAEAIMGGNGSLLKDLTPEDLALLLS